MHAFQRPVTRAVRPHKIADIGYQDEVFQLTLKAGENQNIDRKLTGVATLIVRSQPAEAMVYIDKTLIGPTPQTKQIVAGTHVIRIVSANHKEWIDTRTLAPGKEVIVDAELIAISGNRPLRPSQGDSNLILILYGVVGGGIVILTIALVILLRRRTQKPLSVAPTYTRNITPHQSSYEPVRIYN